MRFDIINPSDEAYIEGSFKACCLATLWFGNGKYGLREIDGDHEMPLFLFGLDPNSWLEETFGNPLEQLLDMTSMEEIGKALISVTLVGKRSSLNDFTSYAHELGEAIVKKEANSDD